MSRKIIMILLLIAILFLAGGCPFLFNSTHTRAHRSVIERDMIEIHHFTDRHFWNYEWDSPEDN